MYDALKQAEQLRKLQQVAIAGEREGGRGFVASNYEAPRSVATGSRPVGEANVRSVCETLGRALNTGTPTWDCVRVSPRGARTEDGVDARVSPLAGAGDGGTARSLQIQVVSASIDSTFWQAQAGAAAVQYDAGSLASAGDALIGAVRKKRTRAHPAVLLALDAMSVPALAMDAVRVDARLRHGAEAGDSGFAEVWVVGPTPEMSWRFDGTF